MRRLGVPPRAAVAVEDTVHGVTAAQAAGIACIAIPNPHVAPETMAHADLTLGSAADLSLLQALAQATARC